MNKFMVALLLGIAILLSSVSQAIALSCAPPQPVKKEMEQSSIVFKGKAIEIKKNGLAVFQVEEAWKGVSQPVIQVYDNGWDPYIEDADYLVFGSLQDGKLRRNLCGRTGLWDKAQEDAMKEADLTPIAFNKEEALPIPVERSHVGFVMPAALLSFLILFAVVLWRRLRRRSDK